MQFPPHLSERLRQFSASRIIDYLCSRPWLSGTTAVCLLLLGLIVWFQPADEAYVADENLEDWPSVELGEFTATAAALPEIEPLASPSAAEGPGAISLPPWATAQAIPTEAPPADQGIQPVHAEPYRRGPASPAWLTGTIEEIAVEPAGFPFDASRNGPSTYQR